MGVKLTERRTYKNKKRGMNGSASFEAKDSEFVEVDPTGRYGRLFTEYPLFYSPTLPRSFILLFLHFHSAFS